MFSLIPNVSASYDILSFVNQIFYWIQGTLNLKQHIMSLSILLLIWKTGSPITKPRILDYSKTSSVPDIQSYTVIPGRTIEFLIKECPLYQDVKRRTSRRYGNCDLEVHRKPVRFYGTVWSVRVIPHHGQDLPTVTSDLIHRHLVNFNKSSYTVHNPHPQIFIPPGKIYLLNLVTWNKDPSLIYRTGYSIWVNMSPVFGFE